MEYKSYKLSEITTRLSSGKSISSECVKEYGNYCVIGGNGKRGFTDTFNFSGECAVIGRQGAYCGNVLYFNGDAYMTEHAVVAVVNDNHCMRYIAYYLDKMNLGSLSGQAAQPGISVKVLGKQKLLLPNLSTQQKIASILSAYDDLIENNNKRIKILEKMAENLYKEWFVRFRFPGHESVEFENGVPKGWKVVSLVDYANIIYGFPFNSALYTDEIDLSPIVRIRDVLNGETKTYSPEICSAEYSIKKKDVLIGMDGIFHMNIWKRDGDKLNQRVAKVSAKYNSVSNLFLYFSIYPSVKQLEQIIQGTTVAHLSAKDMKKMKILMPTQGLLKKSYPHFENLLDEIIDLWNQNKNLTKQRDLLLPRLMSGKLEV